MWTTEIPRQIIHALDEALWRRGFREPRVRGIARRGLLVSALALVLGSPLALLTPLLFWFGVGSLLAAWNFCALVRWIARLLPAGWSSGTLAALLIHTNARLLITGFILYICIVTFKASVFALLAGLTVIVFEVTVTGLWTTVHKPRPQASDVSPPLPAPCKVPVATEDLPDKNRGKA